MRIGVFAGNFIPEVGGGNTFTSHVFDVFLKLAEESRHEFVAFCDPVFIERQGHSGTIQGVDFCPLPSRGFWGKSLTALKHYSPLFAYLFRRPGALERLANRMDVKLVWFVGGGAYDTLDIPYVATVWDVQHRMHPWFPETSSGGRWDYRELTQSRFLRRATYVITGTQTGRDQLGWYYQIPQDRIRILPHPTPRLISSSGALRQSREGISAFLKERYLFYPAQFWAHKNHVNLLYALKVLHDKHGVKVKLALSGSDKGNLNHVKSLADELGLSPHVLFLGFVTTDEMVDLYRNALALVYVSFSGPENLPPLEAFSLGCPVVISDYPGAREQVGDAAVYIDPHDPEKIAEGIKLVIERDDLRQELIKKGKARACGWTAADYVRKVFSIFDEFATIRRCWR